MNNDECRLIDATLREGFQAPNVAFNFADVKEIAEQVVQCGANMLEVGHPYVSKDAMHHTRAVVEMQLGVPVLAHARAARPDIHAVHQSGADWVGIFVGVNEISEKARLGGRNFAAILQIIEDSVSYAKSLGLSVRFTIEDSSRTDKSRMSKAFKLAIEAGADRICYADSVGLIEPPAVKRVVSGLRKAHPSTEIEVHFHNDRGLATANALAAVDAGASWVSVSINGLGERCGITDHAVLAANLAFRGMRELSVSAAKSFSNLSYYVSKCAGQPISKAHPVTGEYAFTHTARLHVLAVEKDLHSYEWIDPQRLGRKHITMPISPNIVEVQPRQAKSVVTGSP
ncbi:LeuA family protein (plasmid) [Neorhizobium sp. DAR64861/K0K2]|uniref:LeuA family protein n=1 Tax=Neorhizobium sp. DAR64861/K0K2 TaxID=3421956 RepID=UPI003D2CEC28